MGARGEVRSDCPRWRYHPVANGAAKRGALDMPTQTQTRGLDILAGDVAGMPADEEARAPGSGMDPHQRMSDRWQVVQLLPRE